MSLSTAASASPTPAVEGGGRRWVVIEIALIGLLFFLYAGWPPPDVNEAHYLGKARHYWNPSWCAGDPFFESADAHLVFYWAFGWLTSLLPLVVVAWFGRAATWILLAWSWRKLSFQVLPRPMMSVLTAGLMIAGIGRLNMAGEWLIGGVEAKGFAFVLVFAALHMLALGKWRSVGPLLGAATSFHVLVGGWSWVAAALAWLMVGRTETALRQLLLPWSMGVLIALPGLASAVMLNATADAEIVRQANLIYVYERLAHHLVVHRFPASFIARHLILCGVWLAMALWLRRETGLTRVNAFVGGAVAIACCGVLIDQALLTDLSRSASLLRLYWYRLTDAVLPVGASLSAAALTLNLLKARPVAAKALLFSLTLLAVACLLEVNLRGRADLRPRAVTQPLLSAGLQQSESLRWYGDWRSVCEWIRQNTASDAGFLTPRRQQTFKWFAHRREVVNWKDVPQDADGLVKWRQRMRDVYRPPVKRFGFAQLGEAYLTGLGKEYDADYVIVDRTLSRRRLSFRRVYPQLAHENSTFEVYCIPVRPVSN